MSTGIKFFLKEEINFEGKPFSREWFNFNDRTGHVDDDIKAQHSADYAKFQVELKSPAKKIADEPTKIEVKKKGKK